MNGVLDPLTGTWMAMTLWRHYEFTRDKTFLAQRAYPVLKGAALFLLDYLIEDDEGNLAIIPSTSPENKYIHPKTGDAMRMTVSSTYHTTLVRVIFEAVIQSSNLLAKDDRLRQRLETALKKIPPVRIGADGTIQEWIEDYREDTPGHRHISHLLGLHPFSTITQDDKDFFNAAGKTVARRLSHGGGHTGWSRAWIINFYSRLFDGNSAHKHIQLLFAKSTLPNLFDTHPPFQIDGNFGATAGIAEMLIQSHADTIHLLPALPDAWPNGHVKGLCARGGFVVDIYWKDKTLLKAVITSRSGGPAILRYADKALEIDTSPGKVYTVRRTPAGDLLPE